MGKLLETIELKTWLYHGLVKKMKFVCESYS